MLHEQATVTEASNSCVLSTEVPESTAFALVKFSSQENSTHMVS